MKKTICIFEIMECVRHESDYSLGMFSTLEKAVEHIASQDLPFAENIPFGENNYVAIYEIFLDYPEKLGRKFDSSGHEYIFDENVGYVKK